MARGVQLSKLLSMLRAETGRSQSVAIGVNESENLKHILRRTQDTLYDDYEWPFLIVERSITLNKGQRYYDLPADIDFDQITEIKHRYGNVYIDVYRGITFDDYSIYDSSDGEQSSPLLKWDIRLEDTTEQLEMWPVPSQQGSVHFFGKKKLNDLIQEDDRAELDDHLIVLYAAAEILERQKSPDARSKLQLATSRLNKLRSNSQRKSQQVRVGLGTTNNSFNNPTTVVVGS